MEHEALTRIIIGCAISVHRALGPGFLESVYQNALAHELRKAGLAVHCEKRIQVRYDNALVGDFFADMLRSACSSSARAVSIERRKNGQDEQDGQDGQDGQDVRRKRQKPKRLFL